MKPTGPATEVAAYTTAQPGSGQSAPLGDQKENTGPNAWTSSKVAAWLVLPLGGALLGLHHANASGNGSRNDAVVRAAAPLAGGVLLAALFAKAVGQAGGKARPARPITVKTWTAKPDGSVPFPELDDPEFRVAALDGKAPLAICISGGGVRATTLGLGWLRGLHELGVLQRAKYIMTTSGASWLNGALSFQHVAELGEFLGTYLPPEQCSLKALAQVGDRSRCYSAAVATAKPLVEYVHDLMKKAAKVEEEEVRRSPLLEVVRFGVGLVKRLMKRLKPGAESRSWTKAMTDSFLEPFGLGEADGSTVTCAGTAGAVHVKVAQRAEQAGRGTIYVTDPSAMPFPVMTQVVLMPGRTKYYPFEWTPLYGGCPVQYGTTKPKLGAGWVENIGLNARLLEKPKQPPAPGGSAVVRVQPTGPGSLGEAIGVSSAFGSMTAGLQNFKVFGKLMHKWLGWHTAQYFNQADWERGELELTDGGGTDLFAIFPALRRRVPNIMVFSATTAEIKDYNKFLAEMRDLAMLFGCWTEESKDEDPLPGQVFPSSGFRELFEALRAKVAAGKPPVHVAEYEVLANPQQGVPGGWRARVMWVINERQPAWEAALPRDTRERLEADRATVKPDTGAPKPKMIGDMLQLVSDNTRQAIFFDFPLVSTFYSAYTPEMVSLLSNHAAWMMVQSRELVDSMLGGVKAAAPQRVAA